MESNKGISRIWFFILIVITIPVGGYFSLGIEKFRPDEFWLKFITGGIAMFIVLGGISRMIFVYYRREKDGKAAYRALFVYSFFLICFAIVSTVFYFKIQKDEIRMIFHDELKVELINHFEINASEFDTTDPELKLNFEFAAEMICDDIEREDELLEEMMLGKRSEALIFIAEHPSLKRNYNMVIEVAMDSVEISEALMIK